VPSNDTLGVKPEQFARVLDQRDRALEAVVLRFPDHRSGWLSELVRTTRPTSASDFRPGRRRLIVAVTAAFTAVDPVRRPSQRVLHVERGTPARSAPKSRQSAAA
jgi:hypothetical protein